MTKEEFKKSIEGKKTFSVEDVMAAFDADLGYKMFLNFSKKWQNRQKRVVAKLPSQ